MSGFGLKGCNSIIGGYSFVTRKLFNVSNEKEISLFVYDPTGNNKIWFKDLKIYNDWMWND